MTVFLFPGQGSQQKGMGGDIFETYPAYVQKANNFLGYDVKELCLNDPEKKLNLTEYTQPALYIVSALSYLKLRDTGVSPQFVAGHSLGEYTALFAAECFDFMTGLSLVMERGKLMSEAQGGGMLAIVGLKIDSVKTMLKEAYFNNIDIANHNTSEQIIISGLKEEILQAEALFSKSARMCIPLNVSGAFHSRFMETAREKFAKYIKGLHFSSPKIPVIANFTSKPYQQDNIENNLLDQITGMVRWVESIEYLIEQGDSDFKQVAPGNVLTGMVAQIKKDHSIAIKSKPVSSQKNAATSSSSQRAELLGSAEFKKRYNLRYAYMAGAMYKAIASKELVERLAQVNLLGSLGTGGCTLEQIESDIAYLSKSLGKEYSFASNLICNLDDPGMEQKTVEILLRYNISIVEASAFMRVTPALVYYRLSNIHRDAQEKIVVPHRIIAKISRPEVAEAFMSPAPREMVKALLEAQLLTPEQVQLSEKISMASDLCVEADSGGHTDQGVLTVLMPTIARLRNEMQEKYDYTDSIHVGAAGGIGTPEAVAAAFVLGADFVVTGSINQCTVEAGTSDDVKSILQTLNIQDTTYAPAGDMFEIGAKVQVVRKGLLFAARANKLYQLYSYHNHIDEIDPVLKERIEKQYFKRDFEDIWSEVKGYLSKTKPNELASAEQSPKKKMALIFKWYFIHTARISRKGDDQQSSDYQIHCGPAMGAFNQWVKGSALENWQNRHVDDIAELLMLKAEGILQDKYSL